MISPFDSSNLKSNYTLPKNHIANFIHLFVSSISGKEIEILNEDNLPMMCLSQQTNASYEEFNAFRRNEYYSILIKRIFIHLNLLLHEHPNLHEEEIPDLFQWNHAIENYDKALYEKMSHDYDQLIQKQVDISLEKEQN